MHQLVNLLHTLATPYAKVLLSLMSAEAYKEKQQALGLSVG